MARSSFRVSSGSIEKGGIFRALHCWWQRPKLGSPSVKTVPGKYKEKINSFGKYFVENGDGKDIVSRVLTGHATSTVYF